MKKKDGEKMGVFFGYLLLVIIPLIAGISLGFLLESISILFITFLVVHMIIWYYYIVKHNILLSYSRLRGTWAYKASDHKVTIIFYTIVYLALISAIIYYSA